MKEKRNDANLWERFDPEAYVEANYDSVSEQDAFITRVLAQAWRKHGRVDTALEIGAGPNLYPMLAALPWVNRIDALEVGASNRRYLEDQVQAPDPKWAAFWDLLHIEEPESYPASIPSDLGSRVHVAEGSIFSLPTGAWDAGSMHFVAESITGEFEVFKEGSHRFLDAIKPDGLVVASFMLGSVGYQVNGESFPAVSIEEPEIRSVFRDRLTNFELLRVPDSSGPVRSGYEAMGVLTGTRVP